MAAFRPGTSPPPVNMPRERMGLEICAGINNPPYISTIKRHKPLMFYVSTGY
jgi:hypothetical protein